MKFKGEERDQIIAMRLMILILATHKLGRVCKLF